MSTFEAFPTFQFAWVWKLDAVRFFHGFDKNMGSVVVAYRTLVFFGV
jgi:hypothetical protein